MRDDGAGGHRVGVLLRWVTGLVLLGTLSGTQPAAAAWSVGGAGAGLARASVLTAVPAVTSACSGSAAVTLGWSPVTLASTYVLQRSVNLGAWTDRTTTASTTATDTVTGLVNVDVRWRVVSQRSAWSGAPSAPTASRVVTAGICL